VDADPIRLQQMVLNLLPNAAKYSEWGRRIRLSVEREGNDVVRPRPAAGGPGRQ
jgi:signal transduction histidine kinase